MSGSFYVLLLVFLLLARKIGKYGGVESFGKSFTQFPVPTQPKSVYFTGAGVFFFWQVGAAKYMQETCNLKGLPIVGASAGSLTGLLLLVDVDFDDAVKVALTQSAQSGIYKKQTGLAGELGPLLFAWLNTVIPDNVPMDKLSELQVAITPAAAKSPKLVNNFTSKGDVIAACMASCHVPVFLDGRVTTKYREEQVLDGSFWYFVTKSRLNSLPLPAACTPEEVLWIDYTDDDDFMASIDGNFLSIVSPSGVLDMIEYGYNHMKREHYNGRLPIANRPKPSYVLSSALKRAQDAASLVSDFSPDRAVTFATESVKWFLAAASVDSIATSIVNLVIFSCASTALSANVLLPSI